MIKYKSDPIIRVAFCKLKGLAYLEQKSSFVTEGVVTYDESPANGVAKRHFGSELR